MSGVRILLKEIRLL